MRTKYIFYAKQSQQYLQHQQRPILIVIQAKKENNLFEHPMKLNRIKEKTEENKVHTLS